MNGISRLILFGNGGRYQAGREGRRLGIDQLDADRTAVAMVARLAVAGIVQVQRKCESARRGEESGQNQDGGCPANHELTRNRITLYYGMSCPSRSSADKCIVVRATRSNTS